MVSDPRGGLGLAVVHRGKELGGESGGLGMSERAKSLVSDPRGGSRLRVVHRGKGFGGESGGLGMSVSGQGAWFRIREGGQD